MGQKNNHLENLMPNFYRREIMHVMIFTFIDTYKLLFPSVTLLEAAGAFMKHYRILEDHYSTNTVVAIYLRVNQDLIDAERFQNKQAQA